MGLAPYRVTSVEIWFKGQRIDALPVDKRAQMGLGMSFQRPPALEGVTVEAFMAAIGSPALLESEASALDFNGFAERDVNAGVPGGDINGWEEMKLPLKRHYRNYFAQAERWGDA